jgi:UDP-GlcNAc:undecaprenyl-phosphate/decaprenyl-phosphate GlcNAc-1-phosphate transferase
MTAIIGNQFIIGFGAAFLLGLILTPVFGRVSAAVGLIDYPSTRKFHLTTMPMMGGLAVATSFAVIYLTACKGAPPKEIIGAIAASFIMLSLGLIDDIRNIPPKVKLAGQFVSAGVLLICGLHISLTGITAIDYILTLIWFAGIVNCMNLLDNIDGLAGGTAAIAGCFFFIAAAVTGKTELAIAAVIFSGACMGFLFHNFHPAAIFSGDAGSMFMGSMLASFGLFFMTDGDGLSRGVAHLFPGVILGLLIFDTGLVTVMRISHGKKITEGGKDHTSHRLCNLGFSIQTSVLILFAACFLFGAAGVAMLFVKPGRAVFIPAVLFSITVLFWFLLGKLYNYTTSGEESGS